MGNCGSGEQTKKQQPVSAVDNSPDNSPTKKPQQEEKPAEETKKTTTTSSSNNNEPTAAPAAAATKNEDEEKKKKEQQEKEEKEAAEKKKKKEDDEAATAAAKKKAEEEEQAAAEAKKKAEEEEAAAEAKKKAEEEEEAARKKAEEEEAERKRKEEEEAAEKKKKEEEEAAAAKKKAEEDAEKEKKEKLEAAIAKYQKDMADAQVFRPEGPTDARDLAIFKECLNNPSIQKMKEIFGLDEKIRFREMIHKMRVKKGALGRTGFHNVLGFIIGNFFFYLPPAAADMKSKKSETVQCLGSMYLKGVKFSEMSNAEGKRRILLESAVPRKLGKGKKPDPAENTLQIGFDNEESLRRFQAAVEAVAVPPMPEEVAAAAASSSRTRGKSFFVGTCDKEPEPSATADDGEEGENAAAENGEKKDDE